MNTIKVMSIFGTRPEAIKMAPLVKVLEQTEGIESIVCVTAQHREMLDQVLEIFDLQPQYDLNIMQPGQTLSGITTRALLGLEDVLKQEQPHIVLVHGDTSTTFAGALAAYYQQIQVGHVEAGLRTYDKYQPFPEEMNRRLTGALTDLHFAPTKLAKEHLLKENIAPESIFITGNTVIDALAHTIEESYTFHESTLNDIDFQNKRIIAMTAHRRENLGEPLKNICRAVKRLVEEFEDVEVVYAVHKNPAVSETVHEILGGLERVHLTDPLDLKDMHNLMYRSFFVMTDSGGLQEEVPSMGKPVLVLRNVTERPEGIEAGTLKLAGTEEQTIYTLAKTLLTDSTVYESMAQAKNPFGDGHASKRIAQAILYAFGKTSQKPEDYYVTIQKEEKPMKEERMAILRMLEKGMITVDEAERLLGVLHNGLEKEGIGKVVGNALEKAGSALGNVAKSAGETAEKWQPKVKEVANKVADKVANTADDMQPKVRSAAFRMTEKVQEWKEERLRAKRSNDEKAGWTQEDKEELNIQQQNTDAEETLTPEEEAVAEKYAKNVETVMNSVQEQMNQIDDFENFLKSAFGEFDPSILEEEDQKEKTDSEEQNSKKENETAEKY